VAVPDAVASVAVPEAVDLKGVTVPDDVALKAGADPDAVALEDEAVAMPEIADLEAVAKGWSAAVEGAEVSRALAQVKLCSASLAWDLNKSTQ
jgi:hypothetical protein